VPRLQRGAAWADDQNVESPHALPAGVVTFLLTDIEGSTRLWEREPEAMREALARHDALMLAYVRRLHGHVVKSKGEGDSVFAVFRHARDAVAAALVLQCALGDERWATRTPIQVRMAIHTGQVELRDGDYYGPTVNRCARLRALARGGQVLVSGATAQLTRSQLPPSATLHDLGTHRLKDLSAPERVWQLSHPKLAGQASEEVEASSRPSQRVYKLTDHLNRTPDGRQWGERVTHAATGLSIDDHDGSIRCYGSPMVAALMNPLHERFHLPRLWEATVDAEPAPGEAIVHCQNVTTRRQVPLPTVTGQHHARFAVLCARAAFQRGSYRAEFNVWADGWLVGNDSSGVAARALADDLEAEAHRGAGLAHPEELMAANAARAAAHASKLSWLAGRARDEENTSAIALATEVVHTALRITWLDLIALAEQAMPRAASPVPSIRPATPTLTRNRILRALPT
jgi:class 3 adenylate cyclase